MNTRNFYILGVFIDQKCIKRLLKVLKPGYYSFNQSYIYDAKEKTVIPNPKCRPLPPNFFGENISISVLAGKNGSGKSSLLDLIYRIIYNFACNHQLVSNKPIKGIYAQLFFYVDGKICSMKCKDSTVTLRINGKKKTSKESISNIFYTIVENYAFSAFNETEYSSDTSSTKNSWLHSVFHKNDGYQMPLVLTPFRDEGRIDVNSENDLTKSRLCALFIYHLRNAPSSPWMLEEYVPVKLTYQPNLKKIKKCLQFLFSRIPTKEKKLGDLALARVVWKKFYGSKNTENLFLPLSDIKAKIKKDLRLSSCIYITYKIYKIIEIYPFYKRLKKRLEDGSQNTIAKIIKLLLDDKSHVTLKLRQATHFVKECMEEQLNWPSEQSWENFPIPQSNNLSTLLEKLPPSFFQPNLFLQPIGSSQKSDYIRFALLSSGEKQFIYNTTTMIYHIKNLISVPRGKNSRVAYRNINIILDEAELCFHPEFQRNFVNKLISILHFVNEKKEIAFNVILATHSPFILSDIPEQNILFLEKGLPSKNTLSQTFGANISDLLRNNFFLQNGFSGAFAIKKIKEVLSFLTSTEEEKEHPLTSQHADENSIPTNINKNPEKYNLDNYDDTSRVIDLIGEKLIQHKLRMLLISKAPSKESTHNLTEYKKYLEEELKFISNQLEEEK